MTTTYREVEHPRNSDGTWKDKARRERPDIGFAGLGEADLRTRRVRGGWTVAAELVCDTTAWAPTQQRLVWERWERSLVEAELEPAAMRNIGRSVVECYVKVERSDIGWTSPEAREAILEDAADAFADSLTDSLAAGQVRPGDHLPRALDAAGRVVGAAAYPSLPVLRHDLREGGATESSRVPMLTVLAAMASEHGTTDPARWQRSDAVLAAYRDVRSELAEQHHPAPAPETRLGYKDESEFYEHMTALQAGYHKEAAANLAEWLADDPERLASLAEPVGAFMASRAFKTGERAAMHAESLAHHTDSTTGRPAHSRDRPYKESPDAKIYSTAESLAGGNPGRVRLICDSIHQRRAATAGRWHFQRTWNREAHLPQAARLEAALRSAAVGAADSLYTSGVFKSGKWPWRYTDLNQAQTGLALMFAKHKDEDLEGLLGSGKGGAAALNGGLSRTPAQFFIAADEYARATNFGAFLPDWGEGTIDEARVLSDPLGMVDHRTHRRSTRWTAAVGAAR